MDIVGIIRQFGKTGVVALVLMLIGLAAPARATLIVMIPSKDGLVVAADSRVGSSGIYCDHQLKILEPQHLERTIVTVAGTLAVMSNAYTPSSDPCKYYLTDQKLLDVQAVVLNSVDRSGARTGLDVDIFALASRCRKAVRDAEPREAGFNDYRGKLLFGVVIATYKDRIAEARAFTIELDQKLAPVMKRTFEFKAADDEQGSIWAFGDADSYNQVMKQNRFLSDGTRKFINAGKPVKDTTTQEAEAVAIDLIHAAARVAAIARPPGDIGGPVDVVLLGAEPRPRRLQWKQ
jgi:hypothetical protein